MTGRVVLLLHDQLQDGRVWHGFADRIGAYAEVVKAPVTPPAQFYQRPSGWAEHAGREARNLLAAAGPAALTVATGWATGAALSLADDGLSQRTLLINPGPTPEALLPAFRPPTPDDIGRDQRPDPTPEEEMRFGAEEAEFMIEAAMDGLGALGEEERRLVRQIATEQFVQVLPLSLHVLGSVDFSDEPDWVQAAARHPRRCVVALSRLAVLPFPALRDLLPDLLVVDLPLVTPLPWLEDPGPAWPARS